jgi:hypothetical protein
VQTVDPGVAKKILQQVEEMDRPTFGTPEPVVPLDTVFHLHGGYEDNHGRLVTEFEVRELTGRDEEFLGRIKDPARMMIAMLTRGLVRVGDEPASDEVLDGLIAGDWETILLAVRIVTFGRTYTSEHICSSCGQPFESTVDLIDDLSVKTLTYEDRVFDVIGRKGAVYRATPAFGYAQRRILLRNIDETFAEMNTLMLKDCVLSINDRPVLTKGDVLDIPLADRRLLVDEIDKRRAGPELAGVRTKCPACDEEQLNPLNVVALFQG